MSSTQTLVAHDLVVPRAMPAPKPGAGRTRLLLEGPIIPTLLRLGAPNVIVNVVLIAVTASVDAHFVGHLGSNALAGLALVFPLLMLMQQIANGSMGGAVAFRAGAWRSRPAATVDRQRPAMRQVTVRKG